MAKDELLHERLTESIIGGFYEVYNRLGYGFLESIYAKALTIELRFRGHKVETEVIVHLYYRGFYLGRHRLDHIVDDEIIVEVKAADSMPKVAARQCLSYLRATRRRVGLALNFGVEPQIKRVQSSGNELGPNTEVVFPIEAGPDSGMNEDDGRSERDGGRDRLKPSSSRPENPESEKSDQI